MGIMDGISEAVDQMDAIIENDQIWSSLRETNHDRGVMKDELMAYEEPSLYIYITTFCGI